VDKTRTEPWNFKPEWVFNIKAIQPLDFDYGFRIVFIGLVLMHRRFMIRRLLSLSN
jgi:hypothetical protein